MSDAIRKVGEDASSEVRPCIDEKEDGEDAEWCGEHKMQHKLSMLGCILTVLWIRVMMVVGEVTEKELRV